MLQLDNVKGFRFCLLPPLPPQLSLSPPVFKRNWEMLILATLCFPEKQTKHLRSAHKLKSDYESCQ